MKTGAPDPTDDEFVDMQMGLACGFAEHFYDRAKLICEKNLDYRPEMLAGVIQAQALAYQTLSIGSFLEEIRQELGRVNENLGLVAENLDAVRSAICGASDDLVFAIGGIGNTRGRIHPV